jgi:hypothetical protein
MLIKLLPVAVSSLSGVSYPPEVSLPNWIFLLSSPALFHPFNATIKGLTLKFRTYDVCLRHTSLIYNLIK